jgi:hypothetical protein
MLECSEKKHDEKKQENPICLRENKKTQANLIRAG